MIFYFDYFYIVEQKFLKKIQTQWGVLSPKPPLPTPLIHSTRRFCKATL